MVKDTMLKAKQKRMEEESKLNETGALNATGT
jgi:hypothetical protein